MKPALYEVLLGLALGGLILAVVGTMCTLGGLILAAWK